MEQRLHFVFHLPNDHPREARASYAIISRLRTVAFPGEGYSLTKRKGYWRSRRTGKWVRDYNTLYITDIPAPNSQNAQDKLKEILADIRIFADTAYKAIERPQEEFWITSHLIDRH